MKIHVVGSGITGSCCARLLANKGHNVIVFEKENYIGGLQQQINASAINNRVYFNGGKVTPQFTSNILEVKTSNHKVMKFLSDIDPPLSKWTPNLLNWKAKVILEERVELSNYIDYPVNRNTFEQLCGCKIKSYPYEKILMVLDLERFLIGYCGQTVYKSIFKPLLKKLYGKFVPISDLEFSTKCPPVFDDNHENDSQRYEYAGRMDYGLLCQNLLDHPKISKELGQFYNFRTWVKTDPDLLINTGSVDQFMNFKDPLNPFNHITLPYTYSKFKLAATSLDFNTIDCRPSNPFLKTYNLQSSDISIVEMIKHFENIMDEDLETNTHIPTYPVRTYENIRLYNECLKYINENYTSIIFCGRLGSYSNLKLDQCVQQALDVCEWVGAA